MTRASPGAALVAVVAVFIAGPPLAAQTLDEWLDEEAFLDGVVAFALPEVLAAYIEEHPPAGEAQAGRYDVAALQLALRAAPARSVQREACLDELLERRAALVAAHPAHPKRALWALDQAEDLLYELLPTDASGLTTLFGVPSLPQRTRAERAAREMDAMTSLAEVEIDRALLDVESLPGFRENEALQMRRRRLALDERDRRVPVLRGVAVLLRAEIVEVAEAARAERERHLALAAELLIPCASDPEPALARLARLYGALALVGLARGEEGALLAESIVGDPDAPEMERMAAQLTIVRGRSGAEGPEAVLAALDALDREEPLAQSIFYRLLIADARFLARLEVAERTPPARRGPRVREAFEVYLDLLDAPGEAPREAVRAIVLARLASGAERGVAGTELPPIATVARAAEVAQRPGAEEFERREAIDTLERLVGVRSLDERARGVALVALGRALAAQGDLDEAARRFLELARDLPADPEAERAIELAATLGAEIERRSPDDPAARALRREAIALLVERYPNLPSIDRWRFIAGEISLHDRAWRAAIAAFDSVAPDAALWLDARVMRVAALRALSAEATGADRVDLSREVEAASASALEAIDRAWSGADAARKEELRAYRARLRVETAHALRDAGRNAELLAVLEGLEHEPNLDGTVLADALRMRIDALQALGRPEDAQRQVARFLDEAPGQAGRMLDAMIAKIVSEVSALADDGSVEQARARGARELVPLAQFLEAWVDMEGVEGASRVVHLLRAAEAYREGGDWAAGLRVYDGLNVEHGGYVEIAFGRAECLYGLGAEHHAEALDLYRQIVSQGIAAGHRYYWQSQLRMLQIFEAAGRNTERIAPRIERLRLEDPELGGPRYKREFQRLEGLVRERPRDPEGR